MTSGLYRTCLSPFSFLHIDQALFPLLIWSIPRSSRAHEESQGGRWTFLNKGHQYWVFRVSLPQEWLLKLYLCNLHITSNPPTSASESETGLKPRGWSTLRIFKTSHNKAWPMRIWSEISVRHSSQHNRDVFLWAIIFSVAYHMT